MKSTVKVSSKQEKAVASYLDMDVVPRSGASIYKKGDVADPHFLIDCKTTMEPKASYSIKKDVLAKADKERFEDRKPFYGLVFDFGESKNIGKDTFIVLDLDTFKEMYEAYKEKLEENEC